tara:strand:- start:66 stop:1796 length:1731 start_codon:yes stop_codon:yes gene_type:complete
MNYLRRIFNFIDFTRKLILNFIFILVLILVLISFFFSDFNRDEYSPVVVFAPKKINETTNLNLSFFGDELYQLSLFETISAIETASTNESVELLFMDLTYLDISFTGILEIGNALNVFKKSGKKVIAYADFFDKKNYLLASYADSVILNNNGMVLIDGFSSQKLFVKNLLEKLNIGVNTFISGKYKSALDTFTKDEMSEEDKLQTSFYLSEVWLAWKKIISLNRDKVLEIEIDEYINNLGNLTKKFKGDTAKLALDKGLVDTLIERTELKKYISSLVSGEKILFKDNLTNYLDHKTSNNKFAVLVASGEIIDGDYSEGTISSENFTKILKKIEQDKDIKALFLRINSPGGSGFASERIRQRLKLLNLKIPIVISMGDVAASGGYWISMNDNLILANPFTLTGSIGVWAALPNFKDSIKGIGINSEQLSTNDLGLSLIEPPNENLSVFMQSYVDGSYTKFINLVSNNRKLALEETEKIAQGRVWPGESAVKNKLVDQLGVFQDGIEILKKETGVSDFEIKYIPVSPSIFEDLFSSFRNFLSLNLNVLEMIKPLEIQKLITRKNIDISLTCLVCSELK